MKLRGGEDEHGNPSPKLLRFAFDAKRVFADYYGQIGTQFVEPGFPARLEGVWSKMRGYLARISLLLATCRIAENNLKD